ncbi:MAG: radical SAM protein [Clostridiales bacterium]|nr:B12-binding domain-containing radical SAM protein [Eubacteriales bacterium]MDH7567804.1 radical SAM protein [Clostridiales bacterium]
MKEGAILLISVHNQKALGIRYLERALTKAGFEVSVIYFKGYNSIRPGRATFKELDILRGLIHAIRPRLIGISVMTSLYLETVLAVNRMVRENFSIPILWGGVYASLFPARCLEHADFVIRGEGEKAVVELADALYGNKCCHSIQNLAYKQGDAVIINDVRKPVEDLDSLGYPLIGGSNKYFIDNDSLFRGDPQLNSISYELTASRGCPFQCSYCCSPNLHRLYKGKGRYLRFRSVSSVMDELAQAKSTVKNLGFVRFWDEIFPDDETWVNEFSTRYKNEIGLPFEIWGHPLKIKRTVMTSLVKAGLNKVVVGIQSGSQRIRKEIFRRFESQEDILEASRVLSECRVPHVIYDFMLRHPFETPDDLRQTYHLCTRLVPPFRLQLHGLNFLPGSDIVDKAVHMNIMAPGELDRIIDSPAEKQYKMYWGPINHNILSDFWYSLIYMTQFKAGRAAAEYFSKRCDSGSCINAAIMLAKIIKPVAVIDSYHSKGKAIRKLLERRLSGGHIKKRQTVQDG